jgi:hypothetical protein
MSDGALTWREWVWEWGEVPNFLMLPFALVAIVVHDMAGIVWPQLVVAALWAPLFVLWLVALRLGAKYPRRDDLPEWRVRRRLRGIYGGKPC